MGRYRGADTAGTVLDASSSSSHSDSDGSLSKASTTTPASTISSPGLTRARSADVESSRNDDYIALGCIVATACEVFAPEWMHVEQLPATLELDPKVGSQLNALLSARWVCVQMFGVQDATILRVSVICAESGSLFPDQQNKRLLQAFVNVLPALRIDAETWQGRIGSSIKRFDMWATRDDCSLNHMFNTLPSPAPLITTVEEKYAQEALEDLLDPDSVVPGLKTALYPYQRRSAGLMVQRESSAPSLQLDPRLEERIAPDGSTYFYGARDLLFLRKGRYHEHCRGGILAETMGLGKTVIVLATILATKHHLPKMPVEYRTPTIRPKTASLRDMVIAAVNRRTIPWKVESERIRQQSGVDQLPCVPLLEQHPPSYHVAPRPLRWNRKTFNLLPPPKQVILAPTSIIVVPQNLIRQWQSEIHRHVQHGALSVLVMDDPKRGLPVADELRQFDIILFTRARFELEIRDGYDERGRQLTQLQCHCAYIGATRTRDCQCVRSDDLYVSPLQHLHFKRLVIDEGHFFANGGGTAVTVANRLVVADHRWVVSGTPAKDLLGVEMSMATMDEGVQDRETLLQQRKEFGAKEDTEGAIKSLGSLATNFLQIRPWSTHQCEDTRADWAEHIYRHEGIRRTYSGFSTCIRRTLEAMVIKTRPEDVERDIELRPFTHTTVRLEPSFYDKMTASMFALVLTANAVTSERTDSDYLFHKNSTKARNQLLRNLRQSAFFWTGFSEDDIAASLKTSAEYLAKDNNCTPEDRQLLQSALRHAEMVLESDGWRAMGRSHELGMFVNQWPVESAQHWGFDGHMPLLTGISQLIDAQKHVNERVAFEDPGEGLSGAGIKALAPARTLPVKSEEPRSPERSKSKSKLKSRPHDATALMRGGVPLSSVDGEPLLKKRRLSHSGHVQSSKKLTDHFEVVKGQTAMPIEATPADAKANPDAQKRKRRRPSVAQADPDDIDAKFSENSPYLQSKIVGTSSAKLSYLISKIVQYSQDEKILVFYEGDNIAYYIAQMLELLHIQHRIYAKSLAAHLKSEYVVRFDQESQDRVLLMDVKQAAYGLNLTSASRIYFVNPVCRPDIEAQAIKRAHRIGQTRPVFVETLVLKGTIEEQMLERAKRMTRAEHMDAKILEDDGGMREIIQSARVLPIQKHETVGYGQMAPLQIPQQLWGRPGWKENVKLLKRPQVTAVHQDTARPRKTPAWAAIAVDTDILQENRHARRDLDFVDCTPHHADVGGDAGPSSARRVAFNGSEGVTETVPAEEKTRLREHQDDLARLPISAVLENQASAGAFPAVLERERIDSVMLCERSKMND